MLIQEILSSFFFVKLAETILGIAGKRPALCNVDSKGR